MYNQIVRNGMQDAACDFKYRRILLKLSGEGLMGEQEAGIAPAMLDFIVTELKPLVQQGVQVGIVVGGGNLFRGKTLFEAGMDHVTGDQMGMLATVMNALALADSLNRFDIKTTVMSAFTIGQMTKPFNRASALKRLKRGEVVIFSGGTGNPFFTTDSAACLRGIEVDVDLVMKATKVNGIYDQDPAKNSAAKLYSTLTFNEVLEQRLSVMDLTAICLLKDHNIPLRVFNMNESSALLRIVQGENVGTLVSGSKRK